MPKGGQIMSDKKLILIVDDEPDMVDWLKAFFEDNGYATVFDHYGTDGFELAQNKKPDLITLDITMDKETGIKMYRNLHESPETSGIPVIMITGISPEFKRFIESRETGKSAGRVFRKAC